MSVLVTGCTGYVGQQIATRLAHLGWEVVGSSRRTYSLDGIDVVTGDYVDPNFIASIVERCDTIIHFAARTRGHNAEVFRRGNECITALLCKQARRLNKRFIYISSDQAVYQTGFYGKSKRACEEIVANGAPNFVIIRLTAVLGRYAPEMASTFSKIIKRLHNSPIIVVPGNCEFPIAPIWIGDVEQVLQGFLRLDQLPNEVFELCGSELTLASLIDLFERRIGERRLHLRLPIKPLQSVARILKPHKLFARLPLDALLDLGTPVRVSHDKLTRATGFAPTDMATAVAQIDGFPTKHKARGV